MAIYDSTKCGFLTVGKYNLLDISSKLELNTTAELEDVTPLGAANPVMQMNIKKNEITGHEGWYDDATTSIHEAMVTMADNQEVFMFAHDGNTALKACACSYGVIRSEYKRVAEVNALTKASFGLSVTGSLDTAHIIAPLQTVTTDGNNESLDLMIPGGAGALGCTVYAVVTALTLGTWTGFQLIFEDSSDGNTYVTHTTMDAITVAGGAYKIASDMTVNQYGAVKWDFTGTGAGGSATFALAVKVNRT